MANELIKFTARQEVNGTFNPATNEIKLERGSAENAWLHKNGAGNLSDAEQDKIRTALADKEKTDLEPAKQRVAEASEKKWDGRYSREKEGEEIGLGQKGDRVRAKQQELVDAGYDIGKTGAAKNGVDGFWGDRTEKAWQQLQGKSAKSVDHDLDRSDPVDASAKLNELSDKEVKAVDEKVKEQTGKDLKTEIDGMDKVGPIRNPFAIKGNNADMRDFLQEQANGERNEGPQGEAKGAVMEQLQRNLLESRTDPNFGFAKGWGTDEHKLNRVIANASNAQLAELDRRLKTGIKDGNDTVRYDDGLRGFINGEIGNGFLGLGSDHREALLARVDQALDSRKK